MRRCVEDRGIIVATVAAEHMISYLFRFYVQGIKNKFRGGQELQLHNSG